MTIAEERKFKKQLKEVKNKLEFDGQLNDLNTARISNLLRQNKELSQRDLIIMDNIETETDDPDHIRSKYVLRKKKTTTKPKRKVVKKPVKKCGCK